MAGQSNDGSGKGLGRLYSSPRCKRHCYIFTVHREPKRPDYPRMLDISPDPHPILTLQGNTLLHFTRGRGYGTARLGSYSTPFTHWNQQSVRRIHKSHPQRTQLPLEYILAFRFSTNHLGHHLQPSPAGSKDGAGWISLLRGVIGLLTPRRAVMNTMNTHSAAAGALLLARPPACRRKCGVRLMEALKVPWPCEPCAAVPFHSGLCYERERDCATAIDDDDDSGWAVNEHHRMRSTI